MAEPVKSPATQPAEGQPEQVGPTPGRSLGDRIVSQNRQHARWLNHPLNAVEQLQHVHRDRSVPSIIEDAPAGTFDPLDPHGSGSYYESPALWTGKNEDGELYPQAIQAARDLDRGRITPQQLFRSYKSTPHQPAAVFLKYIVHRHNHQEEYDDPEQANRLNGEFLHLAQQGEAARRNGHLSTADLTGWATKNHRVVQDVLAHRDAIQQDILKGIGLNVRDINGQPHVALTRGLNSDIMTREHPLSSWADIPDTGFGSQMHHAWVPVKDVWFGYPHFHHDYSNDNHENEYLVSHSAPKYQAEAHDITPSRIKNGRWWHQPQIRNQYGEGNKKPYDLALRARRVVPFTDQATDQDLAGYVNSVGPAAATSEHILDHKNVGPLTRAALLKHKSADRSFRALAMNITPREEALGYLGPEQVKWSQWDQGSLEAVKNPHLTHQDLEQVVQHVPPGGPYVSFGNILRNPSANSRTAEQLWQRVKEAADTQGARDALAESHLTPPGIIGEMVQQLVATPTNEEHGRGLLYRLAGNDNLTVGQGDQLLRWALPSIKQVGSNNRIEDIVRAAPLSAASVEALIQATGGGHNKIPSWLMAYAHNPRASEEGLTALTKSKLLLSDDIRLALLSRERTFGLPPSLQNWLLNQFDGPLASTHPHFKDFPASKHLAPETVAALATHPSEAIRSVLHRNKSVTPAQLEEAWPKGIPFPKVRNADINDPHQGTVDYSPAHKNTSIVDDGNLDSLALAISSRKEYASRRAAEHLIKPFPATLAKSEGDDTAMWHAELHDWLGKQGKDTGWLIPMSEEDAHAAVLRKVLMPTWSTEILEGQAVQAWPARPDRYQQIQQQLQPGQVVVHFQTDQRPQWSADGSSYWTDPVQLTQAKLTAALSAPRGCIFQESLPGWRRQMQKSEPLLKMAQLDPTKSPSFQKWFNGSKAVNAKGNPQCVFHGSTHVFKAFSDKRGNPENYYGRAHYFSNEPDDINKNYSGVGPDLRNRIQQTADALRYNSNHSISLAAAKKKAERMHVGQHPNVSPVYLNLKNPVVVQKNGGTRFGINQDFDENGELVGEESGPGIALLDSIDKTARQYGIDPEHIRNHLLLGDDEEYQPSGLPKGRRPIEFYDDPTAYELEQALRSYSGLDDLSDNQGNTTRNEFIRDVWKNAGHDGVIMNAYDLFGPKSPGDKGMEGVTPNTRHYVAFEPNQIKSIFNQNFNPKVANFGKGEVEPTIEELKEFGWTDEDLKWVEQHKHKEENVSRRIADLVAGQPKALAFPDRYNNAHRYVVHRNTRQGELPWRVTHLAPGYNQKTNTLDAPLEPLGHVEAEDLPSAIRSAHENDADIYQDVPFGKSEFTLLKAEYDPKEIEQLARQLAPHYPAADVNDMARKMAPFVLKTRDAEPAPQPPAPPPIPDQWSGDEEEMKPRDPRGNPAFDAWFQGSRATFPSGQPLVAFHGTAKDFNEFQTNYKPPESARAKYNPDRSYASTSFPWAGPLGAWFTAQPQLKGNYDAGNAEYMATNFVERFGLPHEGDVGNNNERYEQGSRVIPVHLAIRNPAEFEGHDDLMDQAQQHKTWAGFRQHLEQKGHDGVVIRNSMTDGNVDRDDWVAFHPHQVKSAIGNAGTFDPQNPHMGKSILDPNAGYSFSHGPQNNAPGWEPDMVQVTAHHGGQPVGYSSFLMRPHGLEVASVGVLEEHQRKGVASAMYAHAEKTYGKKVHPSSNQSADGKGLWAGNAKNPRFGKSEDGLDQGLNLAAPGLETWEKEAAEAQLGHNPGAHQALQAARFLTGGKKEPDMERYGTAQRVFGDHEKAALYAYQIPDSEKNLRALRAAIKIGGRDLQKTEPEQPPQVKSVEAGEPAAVEAADAVRRAFGAGLVQRLHLNGRHSQGALAARDPQSHQVYLLKPGSGKLSPAAGVSQEHASQSRREVAFWHLADMFGLGQTIPHCSLLIVDGKHEWAAIKLLGGQFRPLDEKNREVENYAAEVLQPYLDNTLLHRWSALDWMAGNTDSHGQNALVNEGGSVALIDHGSAFAGTDFDPAHDKNSFIPFYLRCWGPQGFMRLSPEERLRYMPRLGQHQDAELRAWLDLVDPAKIQMVLERLGIDPRPTLTRLKVLRDVHGNLSESLNRLWAGAPEDGPLVKGLSVERRDKLLRAWDGDEANPAKREKLPRMVGEHREHALEQLRKLTDCKDGKLFLYRGMDEEEEALDLRYDTRTSWTPYRNHAKEWADEYKGNVVAAWIPESSIVTVPVEFKQATYALEHEVVVAPGDYKRAAALEKAEPQKPMQYLRQQSSRQPKTEHDDAPYPSLPEDYVHDPKTGRHTEFFHGTNKDFDNFQHGHLGSTSNVLASVPTQRHVIYFTPHQHFAEEFANQDQPMKSGRLIRANLAMSNPLDLRPNGGGFSDAIVNTLATKYGFNPRWFDRTQHIWEHFDGDDGKWLVDSLRDMGHDGVIYHEQDSAGQPVETRAVFDPSQIKQLGSQPVSRA